MKTFLAGVFGAVLVLAFGFSALSAPVCEPSESVADYEKTLSFPSYRYPETGQHIREAIEAGHSDICTIDRDGADARRELSLKGFPTKKGFDRDEFPMAMCEEGGEGASVKYISPSDNRGAGSWVGHQLSSYPDGTKVKITVE